jgi:hypothetical protein
MVCPEMYFEIEKPFFSHGCTRIKNFKVFVPYPCSSVANDVGLQCSGFKKLNPSPPVAKEIGFRFENNKP